MLCNKCGQNKLLEEFVKRRKAKSGRIQPCKTCQRIIQNKSRETARVKLGLKKRGDDVYVLPSGKEGMLCPYCDKEKSMEEFCKDKRRKSGRARRCKICDVLRTVVRRDKNREGYNAQARVAGARRRQEKKLQESKSELPMLTIYLIASEQLLIPCYSCDLQKPIRAFPPMLSHNYWSYRCTLCRNVHARDCQRNNRRKNPTKIRERDRAGYQGKRARNPAGLRKQKQRITARRRTRKKGLPDTFTTTEHAFMLSYWSYACAICGNQEGFHWTLADDHVVPISDIECPGTIALNILPLCHGLGGCNNSKSDKNIFSWLLERFGKRKMHMIEKKIAAYFEIVRQRQHKQAS